MIHVVGLSPAWQTVYEVESLGPGELLRSSSVRTFPSGKATNAARHAATLAVVSDQVTLSTPVGGEIGAVFQSRCDEEQFELRPQPVRSGTRCCTTILEYDGRATELIENAPTISAEERRELVDKISTGADDVLACCGSLPPGTPAEFYGQLIAEHPGRSMCDASGQPLIEAARAGVTIAKPNRDELAAPLPSRS